MTLERWQELVGTIKDRFPGATETKENMETGPGTIHTIEFSSPAGRMRLELVEHPRVIGEKTLGGRKVGAAAGIQKIYSSDETVTRMSAYRLVGTSWEPFDAAGLLP